MCDTDNETLEQQIGRYIDSYELVEGNESYVPSEDQRMVLLDFALGMLEDKSITQFVMRDASAQANSSHRIEIGGDEIESPRDTRQALAHDWCSQAFGDDHAKSIPQRAIRLIEEAVETGQAAGCDPAMVHKLVDYVYAKPIGELRQEIGGVGVTLIALAAAAHVSAEQCEIQEMARILSKSLDYFAQRNAIKNEAGFGFPCTKQPDQENGIR